MRRIALFSDIHGNVAALAAVLSDIAECRATERYCLGDLVGYGPDPVGVVDAIRGAGIPTVRGNYDEGIGQRRGECGCYYATEQARLDGVESYAFTERLIDDERAEWLANLPTKIRLEIAGVRMLLAHGSPRKINEYLMPDRPDSSLARLAAAAAADVVCVGHVHVPYHRLVPTEHGTVHFVSTGSVGKPKDGDPRACWVELLAGEPDEVTAVAEVSGGAGATNTFVGTIAHRVSYDIELVEVEMLRAGLPPTLAAALRSA